MEAPDLSGIRVIGFDLDQTLYPKSPLVDEKIQDYLYGKIAEQKKIPRKEAERLFKERYRDGAGLSGSETLRDLGIENASGLVQEALERADIASILTPDPETNRLLEDLRARYAHFDLITGSNKSETVKKLAALDINTRLFSHLITAEQAGKSDGSSYRLWLSFYPQFSPEQFLYIGDRLRSDHEIPSSLGIRTAVVYVQTPDPKISAPQYENFSALRSELL